MNISVENIYPVIDIDEIKSLCVVSTVTHQGELRHIDMKNKKAFLCGYNGYYNSTAQYICKTCKEAYLSLHEPKITNFNRLNFL